MLQRAIAVYGVNPKLSKVRAFIRLVAAGESITAAWLTLDPDSTPAAAAFLGL